MHERDKDSYNKRKETNSRDEETRSSRLKHDKKDEDYQGRGNGKRPPRHESADHDDRKNEKRSKYDSESYRRDYQESDRRSSRDHRRKDDDHRERSHRR